VADPNSQSGRNRLPSRAKTGAQIPIPDDPEVAAANARVAAVAEALFRALKVVKIYESARRKAARPSLEALMNAVKAALDSREAIEIQVRADRLLSSNQPVYAAEPGISDELLRSLFTSGVRAIRFRRGTTQDELVPFLEELASARAGTVDDDIAGRLIDLDTAHIDFEIVDELAEVEEGGSALPSVLTAAYEALDKALQATMTHQSVTLESPDGARARVEGLDLSVLQSAVTMAGAEVLAGDEGLEATVLRAGEIVIDALVRGAPFPPLDAAHALGAVALEHVRSRDGAALMELLATVRSLATEGTPGARAGAEAMLAMLVPGGFLEPVLYEIFRRAEVPDAEFEDLLARIASHAPDALARLWPVIDGPERQTRVRSRLIEVATENAACLEPLTSGDFGADAARRAVDLLVEARGAERADQVLRQLVDDPAVSEPARVRALVRLEGDKEIKVLLAKLRAPSKTTREAALRELDKNGSGIDAAREGMEAFMKERSFRGLDQAEMDGVARAFANVAELRSVRVLDELAQGGLKATLSFSLGGGSVPLAAKNGLAYLKEKRRALKPAVSPEALDAYDDFSRLLLRRVRKRTAAAAAAATPATTATDTAPPAGAPAARAEPEPQVSFSGTTGPTGKLHADVAGGLARAFRLVRTFDTSNAVFGQPIADLAGCLGQLLATDHEIELRIDEGTVYVNRSALRLDRAAHARALELKADLAACGMGGIVFKEAVTADDLRGLVSAIAAALPVRAPDAVLAALRALLAGAKLDAAIQPLSLEYVAETSLVGKSEVSGGALARRAYGRAAAVVQLLHDRYDDALLRRLLSKRLRRAIQGLVGLLEKEPDRALALHALGATGDALVDHAVGTAVVALALGRVQGFSRPRLADLGVAAALHAIAHRTRKDRGFRGDAALGLADDALRRAPYKTVADLLAERSLEPMFATTLVVGYEHTIPEGYPDANEDLPPLLASRTVAVAHRYHLMAMSRTPRQSLDLILESATHDPRANLDLALLLGPVPPGSLVVLEDGRVGVVARAGATRPERPRVRVLENGVSAVLDLETSSGIAHVVGEAASRNDLGPFLFR
jgi:hypothetical protein